MGRMIWVIGIWVLVAWCAQGQMGGPRTGDWPVIGGDLGHTRYSPLDEITIESVRDLDVAWTWTSPDAAIQASHPDNPSVANATYFQCTPLKIGKSLYVTTCLGQAAAIDAGTGKTLWVFNPDSWKSGRPPNLGYISRGAAHWADGDEERIYYATGDSWLYCLDAKTGEPVAEFGAGGKADLIDGVPRATRARGYGHPSAPIIVNGVVVVGSSISDGPIRKEGVPGQVRGFDARTGEPLWRFNCIARPGEFGAESWLDGSNEYTGNANVWTNMSGDAELGYVYLPTSTPTNDFYGGHRLGNGLFAESLVCLDARTGERVWHFQIVHHGLWDYDLPCAPVLFDLTVDGARIPAVAQLTKHGFTFVFNRVTGEPIWPIEEREVPGSRVPGERASLTQPFPVKPPPFVPQGAVEENLNRVTPEILKRARAVLGAFHHGPLFTPPVLEGPLLMLPGYGGGANWPGGALDVETNRLYVPAMNHPSVIALAEPDPARSNFRYTRGRGPAVPTIDGLPLFDGPVAVVAALDLDEGALAWAIPNGGRGPVDHPLLAGTGVEYLGSNARAAVLVTQTLLVVTEGSGRSGSATGGGEYLRFLDKGTGREVHRIDLGAHATGLPMTYLHGGRQYIAVALGTSPASLVALSAGGAN